MGWDYWKITTIVFECDNEIVEEKEFSIEACNFYDIEVDFSDPAIERKHRMRVFERLRATPIPEPILLFYNGFWTPVCEKYKDRVEKMIEYKNMKNIRRILLKTSLQLC